MSVCCCFPLIFTRTKFVDYRLVVAPEFLKDNPLEDTIWDKVTNLCSVDGYRGELSGRRWHLLRLGDWVVFGFATDEFKRKDAGSRNIRGYYGLIFSKECACELDISKIDWKELDETYVGSIFDGESSRALYLASEEKWLSKDIFSHARVRSNNFRLNTDKRYIGIIGSRRVVDNDELYKLLYEALSLIDKKEQFELIVGLRNLRHAEELGTLNVVSYDHPDDGLYDLNKHKLTNAYGLGGFLRFFKIFGRH